MIQYTTESFSHILQKGHQHSCNFLSSLSLQFHNAESNSEDSLTQNEISTLHIV